MRIGIGLNLFQPDAGGVGNYVLTLLRHWPRLAPEHPMVLFTFDHNDAMLAQLPPESRRHEYRLQVQEDVFHHLDKIDLYFCPFGSLWPRPMPLPTALTFHDMQERFFPEFFTAAQLEERFFHYDWSLRMADAVITVSDFTRQSCIDIPGISRWKIRRVYHAPDELPAPRTPDGWDAAGWEKFVFYPANYWGHKNHAALLRALQQLRASGTDVRCVLTGSMYGREEEFRALAAATGTTDLVRHLGRRSRAELSWLFRHARALVFPSLFEGFGIPVVEAMHSGCPVACSGTTGLPEVANGDALYFDPNDVADIARAIGRVWADDALCADLARRGRARAAHFTPERLVAGHLAAFKLAQRRFHPWKHWYRQRYQKPRSEVPRRALLPHEIRAAQRLLRRLKVTG
ncbi:MAG TPA: glycosyltransferase family 1 protein [Opitutaceae bacterium]|nr:glycosyltransferase family 1 protein [Opitutaceae bacterium]